jgi:AMIN domain
VIRINLLKSPSSAGKAQAQRPRTQWISRQEVVTGGVMLALGAVGLLYLAGRRTVYQSGALPAKKTVRDQDHQRQPEAKAVEAPQKTIAAAKPTTPPLTSSDAAKQAGTPRPPQPAATEATRRAEIPAASTERSEPASNRSPPPASGFHLSQVSVQPGPDGVTVALRVEPGVAYRTMTLDNPNRLVIDFQDCRLAASPPYYSPVSGSPLRGVRASQFKLEPPVVRMVLDIASIPKYEIHPSSTGLEIRVAGGRP